MTLRNKKLAFYKMFETDITKVFPANERTQKSIASICNQSSRQ